MAQRCGHLIGVHSLKRLAVDRIVDCFDYGGSKEISFCEPCTKGKHHKSHFPVGGSTRAKESLDLVHTDVCGKLNTKSLGGAEYFLTFIDDRTRYVWVYFLKTKDEVFKRFQEWKAMVEKLSGRKLKVLWLDNGGEYTSERFTDYLRSCRRSYSQAHNSQTPEQNGVAKWLNRTLIEMTRSMLTGSNLSQKFSAETLSTTAYLCNRSPTKAVVGMTPFEAFHGNKPNVKNLRAFGCVSFAHNNYCQE